jgi:hypothetical protein
VFSSTTTPSSTGYNGVESGVAVSEITVGGSDMTAVITVAGLPEPGGVVGAWDLTVDWGNNGRPTSAATLVFNADRTWTYPGGGGRWVQAGDTVMWTVDHVDGLIYTGTFMRGYATGAMGYATPLPNPGGGSFHLVRSAETATAPRQAAPPGPDAVIGPVQTRTRHLVDSTAR